MSKPSSLDDVLWHGRHQEKALPAQLVNGLDLEALEIALAPLLGQGFRITGVLVTCKCGHAVTVHPGTQDVSGSTSGTCDDSTSIYGSSDAALAKDAAVQDAQEGRQDVPETPGGPKAA
jgi:hypothetical protein